MINAKTFTDALECTVHQPVRVVPFFAPGPWGGQWLKEVCDLDRTQQNFAWGFDCVPEENSLLLTFPSPKGEGVRRTDEEDFHSAVPSPEGEGARRADEDDFHSALPSPEREVARREDEDDFHSAFSSHEY